jgi:hypothetical protein
MLSQRIVVLSVWRRDVICCSGLTEYNRAGTLQWSTSGMFLAKILQFLDSRSNDVGEPQMTSHWFNNETIFALCDTTVQSGKILHAWIAPWQWQKNFKKSVNKLIRPNWNEIQWCPNSKLLSELGLWCDYFALLRLRCEFESVFPQILTELGMW